MVVISNTLHSCYLPYICSYIFLTVCSSDGLVICALFLSQQNIENWYCLCIKLYLILSLLNVLQVFFLSFFLSSCLNHCFLFLFNNVFYVKKKNNNNCYYLFIFWGVGGGGNLHWKYLNILGNISYVFILNVLRKK